MLVLSRPSALGRGRGRLGVCPSEMMSGEYEYLTAISERMERYKCQSYNGSRNGHDPTGAGSTKYDLHRAPPCNPASWDPMPARCVNGISVAPPLN